MIWMQELLIHQFATLALIKGRQWFGCIPKKVSPQRKDSDVNEAPLEGRVATTCHPNQHWWLTSSNCVALGKWYTSGPAQRRNTQNSACGTNTNKAIHSWKYKSFENTEWEDIARNFYTVVEPVEELDAEVVESNLHQLRQKILEKHIRYEE